MGASRASSSRRVRQCPDVSSTCHVFSATYPLFYRGLLILRRSQEPTPRAHRRRAVRLGYVTSGGAAATVTPPLLAVSMR
ncbi:hypothetical protein OH76DRAFT_1206052 [Lentinus brumalis]|uniref:Uncharacterized protein n=1 Tax=Lentinus brumalis TaxID=2498619 RepID=A0A371CSW4_9APHY|nr:hypothetical protein OH76DRAFT_1206052 [Polyporus brumalis]